MSAPLVESGPRTNAAEPVQAEARCVECACLGWGLHRGTVHRVGLRSVSRWSRSGTQCGAAVVSGDVEIAVLGPLRVVVAGRPVAIPGRRERTVLAVLAWQAGDLVSTDHLIDAVWGDRPPRTCDKALQNVVLHLRKAIGADAIKRSP